MRAPEFWRHGGLAPALLAPLAWGFDLAGQARRLAVRPARAGVPVICVGNLVAGGAGKTPVALSLGERLASAGHPVHFLTRGYGGRASGPLRVDPSRHSAATVGDEALLLAAAAPTWVARDRAAGAAAAVAAGAVALVMDDGFQNPGLAKDFCLVVVDGGYGFGNGRVMPAGPLRESVARGLKRAHAVAIVGDDTAGVGSRLAGAATVLRARLESAPESGHLAGKRVVAFAGIGRPAKFFDSLAAMGCDVVARHAFADHHRYGADEVMALVEEAAARDALPVTTAKDHVRLPGEARAMVEVLHMRLVWSDPEALDRLLSPLFGG